MVASKRRMLEAMPLYRILRPVGVVNQGQIDDMAVRGVSCAAKFPGVKWRRSYWDKTAGTLTCLYEAPGADSIRRHAELAKLPCEAVSEVVELGPRS